MGKHQHQHQHQNGNFNHLQESIMKEIEIEDAMGTTTSLLILGRKEWTGDVDQLLNIVNRNASWTSWNTKCGHTLYEGKISCCHQFDCCGCVYSTTVEIQSFYDFHVIVVETRRNV